MSHPPSAILLLGPTGSGKTPLGDCLERTGLWGRRCVHFDFGANLRRVAQGGACPSVLTDRDLAVVRRSLETGRLLEDKDFHIAARILRAFAEQKGVGDRDFIILNGLPRHAGQARDVDAITAVREYIGTTFGDDYRLEKPNFYKTKSDDTAHCLVERAKGVYVHRVYDAVDFADLGTGCINSVEEEP